MILLCAIGLYTANVSGQVNKSASQPDSAKISFYVTTYDFGKIKKGSPGTYVFSFKNSGKSSLFLKSVQSTCGCTTPTWPREPVAPGKTGDIKVKYDTNLIGAFTKSVTVESNAKTVTLTIKGAVQQ